MCNPRRVEEGQDFSPPLPMAARSQAFPCGAQEAVVISRGAAGALTARRYALEPLLPVWTLWLGEAPPVVARVSGAVAGRVQQLAQALQAAAPAAERKPPLLKRLLSGGRAPDWERLLRQALLAEQRGEWAQAAEWLEQAGEFAAAGRLYERAAEGGKHG